MSIQAITRNEACVMLTLWPDLFEDGVYNMSTTLQRYKLTAQYLEGELKAVFRMWSRVNGATAHEKMLEAIVAMVKTELSTRVVDIVMQLCEDESKSFKSLYDAFCYAMERAYADMFYSSDWDMMGKVLAQASIIMKRDGEALTWFDHLPCSWYDAETDEWVYAEDFLKVGGL